MKRLHRAAAKSALGDETQEWNWLDEFPPEAQVTDLALVPPEPQLLRVPERPPSPPPGDEPLLSEFILSPRLPPLPAPVPPPFRVNVRSLLPAVRPLNRPFLLFIGASLTLAAAVIGPDVLFRSGGPDTQSPSAESLARARAQAALARPVYPPPEFPAEPVPASTEVRQPAPPPRSAPVVRPSRSVVASARMPADSRNTQRAGGRADAPSARQVTATKTTAAIGPPRDNAVVLTGSPAPARAPLNVPAALPDPALSTPAPPPVSSAPAPLVSAPPATPPVSAPPAPSTPTPTPTSTPTSTRSSTPAAPPSAAATMSPEARARATETASVQTVLDRYRWAFTSLDASAVAPFWPGVDGRALERAFDQLESQVIKFDRCEINLTGARAVASCQGQASTVRKVGSRNLRTEPRLWTFALNRVNDAWLIQNVSTRPGR